MRSPRRLRPFDDQSAIGPTAGLAGASGSSCLTHWWMPARSRRAPRSTAPPSRRSGWRSGQRGRGAAHAGRPRQKTARSIRSMTYRDQTPAVCQRKQARAKAKPLLSSRSEAAPMRSTCSRLARHAWSCHAPSRAVALLLVSAAAGQGTSVGGRLWPAEPSVSQGSGRRRRLGPGMVVGGMDQGDGAVSSDQRWERRACAMAAARAAMRSSAVAKSAAASPSHAARALLRSSALG